MRNAMVAAMQRILATPALVRAPIWVYRAGVGFVFGSRLLMLEHVGRRSGTTRYVVLEVIAQPSPEVFVVASGFGERAQWFRNVMAQPSVKVSVARVRRAPATARRLPTDEADRLLNEYIETHPRAWAALSSVLENTLGGRVAPPSSEVPLVEFRLV